MRTRQAQQALTNKLIAEARLRLRLNEWIDDVITHYRIGNDQAYRGSILILRNILKRFYYNTAKTMMKFDVREYKAKSDTLKQKLARSISEQIGMLYSRHLDESVSSITNTADKFVRTVSQDAIEDDMTILGARRMLANHLKAHKATIAITESQWVVETTRMTVAKTVDKTLKIFAREIADMLEAGMLDDAGKVAGEGLALSDFPFTDSQQSLLNVIIDNTKKIIDPINDRDDIEKIRDDADALGTDKYKTWETIGDGKVRETHQQMQGVTVGIDEPFQLPGGSMRYPGDGSMNADLSELVNCRCVAVYS